MPYDKFLYLLLYLAASYEALELDVELELLELLRLELELLRLELELLVLELDSLELDSLELEIDILELDELDEENISHAKIPRVISIL